MKAANVKVGKVYIVKVTGKLAPVKLLATSPHGGWTGKNLRTGKEIRIKSPAKLRGEWPTKTDPIVPDAPTPPMSAPQSRNPPPPHNVDLPCDDAALADRLAWLTQAASILIDRYHEASAAASLHREVANAIEPLGNSRDANDRFLQYRTLARHVRDQARALLPQADSLEHILSAGAIARNPIEAVREWQRISAWATHAAEVAKAEPAAGKAPKDATPKPKTPKAARRPSLLDLAFEALKAADKPLDCRQLVAYAHGKGWSSDGKTPEATLYSAIFTEIKTKGDAARFAKVGRGQFARKGGRS